jgi:tetratricopeptide (TPR) repeat protein
MRNLNRQKMAEAENTIERSVASAEALLDRGEPLLAYNEAQAGLQRWPDHVRLRQLQALALARSGDVETAHLVLQRLVREGAGDAETLGLFARTHKDLALRAREVPARSAHLRAAFDTYERAYRAARAAAADSDAYYTGINAATMAVLLGDLAGARRVAAEVREICSRPARADEAATSRYWREATLGEAALVLGDHDAATAHYRRAARLADGRYGDVSSTRRQARLLATHLPGVPAGVAEALAIPPVLVFSGHMIDQTGRPAARFPAEIESEVREEVRRRVAALKPVAAYGSAACGADILCLEALREQGCETHIVLPFPPGEFRAASVDFAGADWGARFERAIAAANSVTITSDHRASGSTATFEYANLVLTGMGKLRARVLDAELRGLAVWDRSAASAAGGTASILPLWERLGLQVDHIPLSELRPRALPAPPSRTPEPAPGAAPGTRHEMRAMLFADAVGYSKLSEDQIPRYIDEFLGAVAELNRRSNHRFEHAETAGDGLYLVFRNVSDAGRFALQLSGLANGRDWAACGLPAGFNVRIALHCGPVHCLTDPVTGLAIYTGPHTSRAARIEPITPPGQVYASSAFAAVAAATGAEGLEMGYVGRIPLAKGYGSLGLYHVAEAVP